MGEVQAEAAAAGPSSAKQRRPSSASTAPQPGPQEQALKAEKAQQQQPQPTPSPASQQQQQQRPHSLPSSLRVLLVEHDPSTCHIVAALLRNCSYCVTVAHTGQQALELIQQDNGEHVDLVLCEVGIPEAGGIELLQRIVEGERSRSVSVVMMSSADSAETVMQCIQLGAADFLLKPVRKNELKNLWQHVWRRSFWQTSGSGSGIGTGSGSGSGNLNNSGSGSDGDGQNRSGSGGSDALNAGDACPNGSDNGSDTLSGKPMVFDPNKPEEVPDADCAATSTGPPEANSHKRKETMPPPEPSPKQARVHSQHLQQKPHQPQAAHGQQSMSIPPLPPQHHASELSSPERPSPRSTKPVPQKTPPGVHNDFNLKANSAASKDNEDVKPQLGSADKRPSAFSAYSAPQNGSNYSQQAGSNSYKNGNGNGSEATNGYKSNGSTAHTAEHGHHSHSHGHHQPQQHQQQHHDAHAHPQHHHDQHSHGHHAAQSNAPHTERVEQSPDTAHDAATRQQHLGPFNMHRYHQMPAANYYAAGPSMHAHKPQYPWTQNNVAAPDTAVGASPHGFGDASASPSGEGDATNAEPGGSGNGGSGESAVTVAGTSQSASQAEDAKKAHSTPGSARREAALDKFRKKREQRCFEKKVRYQSRKWLAEQRPRVRGQFVRRNKSEPGEGGGEEAI
eukprot:jgi/Chlat1/5896/Chrsp4S06397